MGIHLSVFLPGWKVRDNRKKIKLSGKVRKSQGTFLFLQKVRETAKMFDY